MKKKTGILLTQLGTPKAPTTSAVRPYLTQFLNDPRVIDIPTLLRLILVNLIIVPFRAPKSAKNGTAPESAIASFASSRFSHVNASPEIQPVSERKYASSSE